MHDIHDLLVRFHIGFGAVALFLFWVPVAARKGSRLHVAAGRWYTVVMYAVCATAFVASIMVLVEPLAIRRPGRTFEPGEAESLAQFFRMFSLFLLMLSVLVFVSIRHGLAALRERRDPGQLSSASHRGSIVVLALLAAVVAVIGTLNGQILLIVFGGIGFAGSIGMYRESRLRNPRPPQLVVAHLSGLIGSGIGAYTAFFAFGGSRLLGEILTGQWQVIPWILPSIIGTFAISRLARRYDPARRKPRPAGSESA